MLARERDDKRQIERALRVSSFDEPDLDERRRLLDECERLVRGLADEAGLAWVTYLRAITFMDEGSVDAARETSASSRGTAGLRSRVSPAVAKCSSCSS